MIKRMGAGVPAQARQRSEEQWWFQCWQPRTRAREAVEMCGRGAAFREAFFPRIRSRPAQALFAAGPIPPLDPPHFAHTGQPFDLVRNMPTVIYETSCGHRPGAMRRVAAALRRGLAGAMGGGLQARHIALAAGLGVAAGLVTGPNLILFGLLIALLVCNAHVRTFAVCWGITLAAAWYLHAAAARIGGVFIDQTPLRELLEHHADSTLAALTGLHQPVVCGGLALAVLFSLGAARTFYTTVKDLLRSLLCAWEASAASSTPDPAKQAAAACPTPPPHARAWYQRLSGPQKLLARFFWGSLDSAPARVQRQQGWLRPYGWALAAPVACAGLYYLPSWLGEQQLRTVWMPKIGACLGMHGVRGEIEYCGWTGRLVVREVALSPWPGQAPAVRIARLEAWLSPGRLLRSQLHAERVSIEGLACPGAGNAGGPQLRVASSRARLSSGTAGQGGTRQRLDLTPLLAVSRPAAQAAGRLKTLLDVLGGLEACEEAGQSATEQAATEREAKPMPRLYVERLSLESLPEEWRLGRHAQVSLGPIASSQRVLGRPVRLSVSVPRHGVRLTGAINLHQPSSPHRIRFEVEEMPLSRLVLLPPAGSGINIRRGTVRLHGHGRCEAKGVDLAVTVAMRNLDVEVAPHANLAGLDARLCTEVLEVQPNLKLIMQLRGPWHAPRWELSPSSLAKQLAGHPGLAAHGDLRRSIALALVGRKQPPAARKARQALARASAMPADPPGEPQAIATDEAPPPAFQSEVAAAAAAGKVPPYPRTTTPDDDDMLLARRDTTAAAPPGPGGDIAEEECASADGSPPADDALRTATRLTAGLEPMPFKQKRQSQIAAHDAAAHNAPASDATASGAAASRPAASSPAASTTAASNPEDQQLDPSSGSALAVRRPVAASSTAGTRPNAAGEVTSRQGPLPPEVPLPGPIGLDLGQDEDQPSPLAQSAKAARPPQRRPQPATVASYIQQEQAAGPTGGDVAAPPKYLQPPAAEPEHGKPRSGFSRWARGVVNRVFGTFPPRLRPEADDEGGQNGPSSQQPGEQGKLDAAQQPCPYDEPAAQDQLQWYRRLWR
jgi:hypothetical protein